MGSPAFQEISLNAYDGSLLSVADSQPFRRIMELDDSVYFQCSARNCPAIMLVQHRSSSKGLLITKHDPKSHRARYSALQLVRLWTWWTVQCALRIVSTITGMPLPKYYQDSASPNEPPQVHQHAPTTKDGWIRWGISTTLWALRYMLFFVNPTWAIILGRLLPSASSPATANSKRDEQFRR
ncbi:hypothetical protein QR680_007378 [Steinernema hermaphroditum]|uniref:Uncharacterized protein n=1 Tax=Steinernema hermaphroditum TaxID=289476 RepID=A0AA39M6B4_9BILA|nr:hypothetical protein QR680_007378 [Steinernema hermaphroditum]